MKKLIGLLILITSNAYAQGNIYTYPPAGGVTGLSNSGSNIVSTVPILLPDGTAAAPSLSFASDTGTGIYRAGSGQLVFSSGGQFVADLTGGGFRLYGGAGARSVTVNVGSASNVLEQLAGTNAQTFNIYNTYTDASNYERASLTWASNIFKIDVQALGSGSQRLLGVYIGGVQKVGWASGGTYFYGMVSPSASDAYDMGESAGQWKSLFLSRSIQGSKSKSLTDAAAAASFVRIAVPTNGFAAGRVIYTATSTDGTNILVSQGSCEFAAADTGGTVTAGTPTCDTPSTAYKRANTLVCTISGAVSTTNYDLQATCTDNLAGSQTVTLYYRLDMPQPNTVTPQ